MIEEKSLTSFPPNETDIAKLESFNSLSTREKVIVETLIQNPTAGNEKIALLMGKNLKTIENQLRSAYKRLKISGDPCQKRITIILMFQKYSQHKIFFGTHSPSCGPAARARKTSRPTSWRSQRKHSFADSAELSFLIHSTNPIRKKQATIYNQSKSIYYLAFKV